MHGFTSAAHEEWSQSYLSAFWVVSQAKESLNDHTQLVIGLS